MNHEASRRMFGLLILASFFAFILCGAGALTRQMPLRNMLGRMLMLFTLGAGQVLVSMQILSIFQRLTSGYLFGINVGLSLLIISVTWRLGRDSPPEALRSPPAESLQLQTAEAFMLLITVIAICALSWVGFAGLPNTDLYHFCMPYFWRQHSGLLPYPVSNPRLVGLVFASEALCLPGLLYTHSLASFAVLTAFAATMIVWVVRGLALHLGVSSRAATAAGCVVAGYLPLAGGLFASSPDVTLAALWFGASVFFLFESDADERHQPFLIGCSAFTFLMACGAKNIVVLQFPCLALCALMLLRRNLFQPANFVFAGIAGVAGLIASGVLWSYVSNAVWFGDLRGHEVLKETISTDFSLSSLWTRLVRGFVLSFSDPIWLPQSVRERYTTLALKVMDALEARRTLPEEAGFYSLVIEEVRPKRGFGLLGFCVLLPSLLAGLTCGRGGLKASDSISNRRLILVVLTVGSMLLCFGLLRWQSIGLARLMLSSVICGAPLSALLFERRWMRWCGLTALGISFFAYLAVAYSLAMRRSDSKSTGASLSSLDVKLQGLQREPLRLVECQWELEPTYKLVLRDVYTSADLYRTFLARVPQPASFGFIGSTNSEEFFLFKGEVLNKVYPLVDCRNPYQLLPPPPDLDYLVQQGLDAGNFEEQLSANYHSVFQVREHGVVIFKAFRRTGAPVY